MVMNCGGDLRKARLAYMKKAAPTAEKHEVRTPEDRMNKTERAYYEYLMAHLQEWGIREVRFEGLTVKLADDTRYTPDFMVLFYEKPMELHEVKGTSKKTGKPRWEDDAKVKFKVCREQNRQWKFFAVHKGLSGGWEAAL